MKKQAKNWDFYLTTLTEFIDDASGFKPIPNARNAKPSTPKGDPRKRPASGKSKEPKKKK